jgi:hypothetical protein
LVTTPPRKDVEAWRFATVPGLTHRSPLGVMTPRSYW